MQNLIKYFEPHFILGKQSIPPHPSNFCWIWRCIKLGQHQSQTRISSAFLVKKKFLFEKFLVKNNLGPKLLSLKNYWVRAKHRGPIFLGDLNKFWVKKYCIKRGFGRSDTLTPSWHLVDYLPGTFQKYLRTSWGWAGPSSAQAGIGLNFYLL